MLRIGVQTCDRAADVAVQHIASLNERIVADLLRRRALSLDVHTRLEPRAESLIVGALTPPPDEIARTRRARRDAVLGKHCLRHLPDEPGHFLEDRLLLRQPRRDLLNRQSSAV